MTRLERRCFDLICVASDGRDYPREVIDVMWKHIKKLKQHWSKSGPFWLRSICSITYQYHWLTPDLLKSIKDMKVKDWEFREAIMEADERFPELGKKLRRCLYESFPKKTKGEHDSEIREEMRQDEIANKEACADY